jgi:hypothetical protein
LLDGLTQRRIARSIGLFPLGQTSRDARIFDMSFNGQRYNGMLFAGVVQKAHCTDLNFRNQFGW